MNALAKVGRFFFKDRMFASSKQLAQSASMLLDACAWAVSTTPSGKQIRCFFSHRPQKKPDVHVHTPCSQRNYPSKKTGCPFAIRFQYVELCRHQEKKTPLIFHRVRISSVVLDHNCKPSVITHRLARESGGGHVKINLSTFHSILMLLFHNPNMSMAVLRPILSKYLPHWKNGVSSQFACNFRKRVQLYLLKNGLPAKVTLMEAQHILQDRPLASEETLDMDDPVLQVNLRNLLEKCMLEDSSTWRAVSFLESTRDIVQRFEFAIQPNSEGAPIAALWMTKRMHADLLRFCDTMFLDAQQRQCMVDSEGTLLCQGCECLCLTESNDFYVWILQTMQKLEPRFNPSKIRIIFADMKGTDTLLSKLGIQDSCSLRCDMWHMMNEVWPKQNAFSSVHYDSVRHFLKGMLESRDKEYWENCCKSARSELMFRRQTEIAQYLDNIHAKPLYYAGYYFHTVLGGSLGKNGDSTAEQNHSSVVAYLGDGGNFSIADQVKALLDRHQDRVQKKTKQEQNLIVSIDRYKSPLPHGYRATEDSKAKKLCPPTHIHISS
jgi:hypothetical protein